MPSAHKPMLAAIAVMAAGTAIAIVGSFLPGCGSDDGGTGMEPAPPDLPPVASFVMDFTDFAPEVRYQPLGGSNHVEVVSSNQNWRWAATNVGVWSTIVIVGLAVPMASLIEAFYHEPTRQPDGTWVWDYNFIAHDTVHLAELHGKVVGSEVHWEMYISKESEYTDFLWYSGISDLDGTEGTWMLYNDPGDPTPLVGTEWHWDHETETGDIKYTNIVPDGPENGGYIFHGTTDGGLYDAFYEIYNKGKDNRTDIEWNRTTKAGRVSDPYHFGDSDWHCWNSQLEDAPCGPSWW